MAPIVDYPWWDRCDELPGLFSLHSPLYNIDCSLPSTSQSLNPVVPQCPSFLQRVEKSDTYLMCLMLMAWRWNYLLYSGWRQYLGLSPAYMKRVCQPTQCSCHLSHSMSRIISVSWCCCIPFPTFFFKYKNGDLWLWVS